MAARIKLGELLVRAGVLDEFKLKAALAEQQRWGGRLGKILVEMGFVAEELLVKALSKQLGIARAHLESASVPAEVLQKIDPTFAMNNAVCPERYLADKKVLVVAMADPTNVGAVDELRFKTGLRIETVLAGELEISQAIDRVFFNRGPIEGIELERRDAGQKLSPATYFDQQMQEQAVAAGGARGAPAPAWEGASNVPTQAPMAAPAAAPRSAPTAGPPGGVWASPGASASGGGFVALPYGGGPGSSLSPGASMPPGAAPPMSASFSPGMSFPPGMSLPPAASYAHGGAGPAYVPDLGAGTAQRLVPPPLPAAASPPQAPQHPSPQSTAFEMALALDGAQKKQLKAIRVMIELLIEKGVFSRDEYMELVNKR